LTELSALKVNELKSTKEGFYDSNKRLSQLSTSMNSDLACWKIKNYTRPVFTRLFNKLDQHALKTLDQSIISVSNYLPVVTKGDGNCLYRALSTAAYGNDSFDIEIRLRTGIKLKKMKDQLLEFIANSANQELLREDKYDQAVST
jgi:hypothetical protein